MESLGKRVWLFFLDFVETVVIALAIFVVVYRFLFQPHQVKGNSMYDNFHDGEYLLTDKISYRFNSPKVGEVIVFKAPQNESYDYIKRIIGLPGDRIKIKDGEVYVNDKLHIDSDYLTSQVYTRSGSYWQESLELVVPVNSYFVLGDNRNHSSDSRDWGPVPMENIIGKAWIRYWPIDRFTVIKNPISDSQTNQLSMLRIKLSKP